MADGAPLFTKQSLIDQLRAISHSGWIENARHGNHGGAGNTLEDLLGIAENKLPLPNAAEWELKTHRLDSNSLVTLFHSEPSPRAVRFVPARLLPLYGWPHQQASLRYPATEMSFRQTITGHRSSDRGFTVVVDRDARKVRISFAASAVEPHHAGWLRSVEQRAGLAELDPCPYWGFDDLDHDAGTKLHNMFFVEAAVRRQDGREQYQYQRVLMLRRFSIAGLLAGIEQGDVYVDFDARTGHNHGTKFRIRAGVLPLLYETRQQVIPAVDGTALLH